MADRYDFWRREIAGEALRHDSVRNVVLGFWRYHAARTKVDSPVAVWEEPGWILWQIGGVRKEPFPLNEAPPDEWWEFLGGTFLHCTAISADEWHKALDDGRWPDGKASLRMSLAESEGLDDEPGGNQAPPDESLADRLAALQERADATPEPTTQAAADAATELYQRIRKVWKLADDERKREKAPHDDAGQAVQDKWLPILNPAAKAGENLDVRRKAFLKKEQAKADAAAAAETARLRKEAAARIEAERLENAHIEAKRIAQERQWDHPDEPAPSVEEIAAEVMSTAPPVDEAVVAALVPEVKADKVLAGGAYARRSGLKTIWVGTIADRGKLIEHLADSPAMRDFLESVVKQAAKAKPPLPLPGVTFTETQG